MYKTAIIGCGGIGCSFKEDKKRNYICTHIQAYTKCKDTTLVALSDIDINKVKKYANEYGIHPYLDYKEMIEKEHPDIVSVCTPTETHAEIVEYLSNHGVKGILCEKPMTNTIADATRMVNICRENNTILQIGYQRRFCNLHKTLKEMITKEEIKSMTALFSGNLWNVGSHMVNLLRYLNGEAEWVSSDEAYNGIIKFKNGVSTTFQSFSHSDYAIFELTVYTNLHKYILRDFGFHLSVYGIRKHSLYSGFNELFYEKTINADNKDLLLKEVKHLVDCLDKKCKNISDGEEALKDTIILASIEESARS